MADELCMCGHVLVSHRMYRFIVDAKDGSKIYQYDVECSECGLKAGTHAAQCLKALLQLHIGDKEPVGEVRLEPV